MPKDVMGHELRIGDEVWYMAVGYRGFVKGTIKSMANQSCLIVRRKPGYSYDTENRQTFNQVFLNTKKDDTNVQ